MRSPSWCRASSCRCCAHPSPGGRGGKGSDRGTRAYPPQREWRGAEGRAALSTSLQIRGSPPRPPPHLRRWGRLRSSAVARLGLSPPPSVPLARRDPARVPLAHSTRVPAPTLPSVARYRAAQAPGRGAQVLSDSRPRAHAAAGGLLRGAGKAASERHFQAAVNPGGRTREEKFWACSLLSAPPQTPSALIAISYV